MLEPMGEPVLRPRVDYATYAALERDAQQKHEWFDGEIFAMAGGTIVHGQLAAAMTVALGLLAQKCGCRVFSSDVKIRVQKTELATLRDYVLVSQHERLVEVFSRDAQGLWVLREARAGGSVPLSALGGSLSVDGVYEGVELEPRALRA